MASKYTPGRFSHIYQSMPPQTRAPIDREVDDLFRKQTGISAKLDWHKAKDRPEARVWLRIRDIVVVKYMMAKYKRQMDFSRHYEDQIRQSAEACQKGLSATMESRGMPTEYEEPTLGKAIEISHIAIEAFHAAEPTEFWVWLLTKAGAKEFAAAEAVETVSLVAAVAGGFLNLAAGLYSIGHAREAGDRGAERNAFKWGFAATIAALAQREDWSPTLSVSSVLGHQQLRGRNVAVRMVRNMGPKVGVEFLKRYEGPAGKQTILSDLGGYD